jgi:DNA-binding HxlR family transcriptional regulator
VIIKETHADSSRCVYRLTDKGHDLLPVLKSMQAWSTKYPALTTS